MLPRRLLATLLTSLSLAAVVNAQNLVSHYRLDEASGTAVSDSSGNEFHGSLVGTHSWGPGQVGGGLDLDGIFARVQIPSDPLQDVSTLTIATWVNADALENMDGIVTKGIGDSSYALQLGSPAGKFMFTTNRGFPAGGVGGGSFTSTRTITVDHWHHLAVTFDGSVVRLYCDGQLDSAHSATGMVIAPLAEAMTIGADFPGTNEFFDGAIDDVRLYDAPLSGAQIQVLYEGRVGTSYCMTKTNSTGAPAQIIATGSESVWANTLTLRAEPLPNQPGLFFYGSGQTLLPFGNGFLCVDGTIGRLPIEFATGNVLIHQLDNTSAPNAPTLITAGANFNFQCWFRDPIAGGAAYNLSDGLEITFTP